MNRIKLPGKEKHKKILLVILVIMAIGVLFYEHNRNIKDMERNSKQEMDKASNGKENNNNSSKDNKSDSVITGDASINNEIKEATTEEIKNDKEIKDAIKEDITSKGLANEKKNYSNKENELYNEAYTLFFSHDYKGAIDKANGLVKEFSENPMGYNIRGIARAYSGDYDGGMTDIDKSLQIDESYGYARFNKALTYELYGNMENALKWYNKDLEVEEYVWTYYGISSIYGRRGDIHNTMKYLNKAIEMDTSVKDVAKEEEDFDPVKDFEAFKKAIYN